MHDFAKDKLEDKQKFSVTQHQAAGSLLAAALL